MNRLPDVVGLVVKIVLDYDFGDSLFTAKVNSFKAIAV